MIKISTSCRICDNKELDEITYLCDSPPANNFDNTFTEKKSHRSFPLILDFCNHCFNLQLRHCLGEDLLYGNYTYVTPKSSSLLKHYGDLLNYAQKKITNLRDLDIVEIGSNSGDLLKFFSPHASSVLGVDPAKNVAKIANDSGIETLNMFFDKNLASEILSRKSNIGLVMARHMFAHNSDPSNMLFGMKKIIGEDGLIFIENAYAIDTLIHGEFDQIYHEHMFFYSVKSMMNLLSLHELFLHDIFFSDVHGGSIVFVASPKDIGQSDALLNQIKIEDSLFKDQKIFKLFLNKITEVKSFVLNEINECKRKNLIIGSYGAPAKAFTMFSLLQLDNETIRFCVDTSPTKIGKVFPISNIPIINEDQLAEEQYDVLLVNAWNYKKDILEKAERIFQKGTKLIFPLPEPMSIKV